ncbi:MAG TPA: sigma-70 family RNA polymerase sigma factor [Planctomycetota bacterium]|nr:sigma-70 family RNA polymerase sigma factor [Planctomycetota bacterium]
MAEPKDPIQLDRSAQEHWALMAKISRGCEDSYRILVREFQGPLLNLFRRLGAQEVEAEDALQETFARLHSFRDRATPTGSFRTLLFTMARRAWIDLVRRRQRRTRLGTGGSEQLDRVASTPVMDPGDRLDLEEAMNTLPVGHRLVLVLSVHFGMGYEEVARIMEIPEGTVKSRVFHAIRKLRTRLIDVESSR